MYWKQLGLQGLPCLETIEIRTQNLSTIIKNHKAHTDTDINADRQDKTSSRNKFKLKKIILKTGNSLALAFTHECYNYVLISVGYLYFSNVLVAFYFD